MMQLNLALTAACFLTSCSASWSHHRHQEKRADVSLGQIYAFGANMSGTPVFFRHSVAYIGNLSLTGVSGTYATFTQENDTHLIAIPSDSSSWNASYLAINATSGAEDVAILVADSNDASLSTTGFMHYGAFIAWLADCGVLEMNWYAQKTDVIGVWALKWAADGWTTDIENSYAIVLRTLSTKAS
ncbi:hypothetical protein HII31_10483 [Pseudocercospora fuligena]|uniref:Cytochrome p450 n=1 Tax=Pseudocercospora fuligena TaxID=685502 RepID=A0A8H6RBW7_9PEZI|nr:hypothetical protein HII31_10483 [Pseudocercospora fuligena]